MAMIKFLCRSTLALSIFVLLAKAAHAQSAFSAFKDSVYIHLDQSRISSGVLYDRVYPWAELNKYQASDTVDYAFATQAWHELYLATYNRSWIHDVDQVWKRTDQNLSELQSHTVGYIDYTYHYIDSQAIENGALVMSQNDSMLYDGDPALNPYRSQRLTIPVINVQKVRQGAVLELYFDPQVQLSNNFNSPITHINIHTPAGSLSLAPHDKKTLDLSGLPVGRVDISFELHMGGGTGVVRVPGYWDILEPEIISSVTYDKCFTDDIEIFSGVDLVFQGYEESAPSQGKGLYTIMYKMEDIHTCGDNKLTKPVIFIDGFDPEDKRKSRIDYIDTDGTVHDPIWSFLNYNDRHLGDELRVLGYDIVILNFPTYTSPETGVVIDGGADYIERNAMVLVRLIQELKQEMADNDILPADQEIVIVGPSMGGQISRYALSYMEKQQSLFPALEKWNHRTRLWLSFDSPHLGANIPIGLQQFLEFFGYTYNNVFARNKFETQIMSTAARQMLINHVSGVDRGSSFFTSYYSGLNAGGLPGSGGYPQDTRRVALSNGLSDGTVFAEPGSYSLKIESETFFGINAFSLSIRNTSETGISNTMDAKALQEGVSYFGFPYYSSSTGTSSPIPGVSLHKKTIDMGIPYAPFTYKRMLVFEGTYFTFNSLPHGSMDVVPGGWNNSLQFVRNQVVNMLHDMSVVKSVFLNAVQDNSSFIPTVSSLGFNNYSFNWRSSFNDRNLRCANEIPFHNYLTSKDVNMEHVTLNEDFARWALEEIQYGRMGCPTVCASGLIQSGGDKYLCQGTSYTFSLDGSIPAGSEFFWERSEGLDVVGTPTGTSITIRYTGGDVPEDQYIRLIVRPKMGGQRCGADYVFNKKVNYGGKYEIKYNYSAPADPQFTVQVLPHITGNTYSWREGAGSYSTPSLLGMKTMNKLHSAADAPQYFYVRINAGGCSVPVAELNGFYPIMGLAMDTSGGYASHKGVYKEYEETFIHPNPAENSWNLFIQKDWVGKDISIIVTGMDGNVYSRTESVAETSRIINAEALAPGTYFITVMAGPEKKMFKAIKI